MRQRLNSTRKRADATIWQHCIELNLEFFDRVHQMQGIVIESFAVGCYILLFILQPFTFPFIAYWRRREARNEIKKWDKMIGK